MLHALLHGKLDELTPEPQRLEDALTSTVFGALVWMEQWDLLMRWLAGDECCCPGGAHGGDSHQVWFWPRMANGVQPDVLLRLGRTLLLVEAKYRSDRHDRSFVQDEAEHPRDQLQAQNRCITLPRDERIHYSEAIEAAIRECRLVQVFLVNGRRRRARQQYEESRHLLPALRMAEWQRLYRLLNEPRYFASRWANDLKTYFRTTGLDPFEGIGARIAQLHAISGLRTWHAQRYEMSFREALALASKLKPLSTTWRLPETRPLGVGALLAHASATRPVLGWRASTHAGAEFHRVARYLNALVPLKTVWSVPYLGRQRPLALRALDRFLASGEPTLLKWQTAGYGEGEDRRKSMSEITREQFSSAVAAAASSVYHLFRQVDRLTDEIKNGLAEATHPLALVPGVLSKSGRSSARMELRNEYGMLFGPAPTDEEEPDEEDEETDEGEDDLQQARKKKGPAEMMPDQRWLAVRIAIYDPQKQDAAEPRIEFGVVGDWRVGGAKPKPDEPIRLARHMLKRIPRALARGGSFAKGTQLETRATAKVDTGRKGGDARRLTCRLLVGGDAVALYEMDKPGAVQELVGRMKAMWEEASRPEPE